MAATKKTAATAKKYVLRIVTTDLNPFLYLRRSKLQAIQFKNCVYSTDNIDDIKYLKAWIRSGQIELASDKEDFELIKEKGMKTTNQYFGKGVDEFKELDKKDDLSDILEG